MFVPFARSVVGLALGAAVLGGALSGCAAAGPAPAPSAPAPSAPTTTPPVTSGADSAVPTVADVDAAYARSMIPHHEQALVLSALVPGRTASAEVADLAFRIDRDQVEEAGQLEGFLRARGVDPTAGTDARFPMSGMADTVTLERLRTTTGPAFDRLWLTTMRAHHVGALDMARRHLALVGSGSALTEFSRTLLVAQQAEIDRMDRLLSA